MKVFEGLDQVEAAVGQHIGYSEWMEITQERVDAFADATGDHQWIHVDPARAAEGPYGTTIAHGYLTASLASWFLPQIMDMRGFSMGVNIGLDRLRFITPVKAGSRLRAEGELIKVEEIKGAIQATIRLTVEIEGEDKPAAVMDTVGRYYSE